MIEAAWQRALTWVAEHGAYFLTLSSNSPIALTYFCAGLLGLFLWRGYRARRAIDRARAKIPLSVGGWGSRGKSGTERLKTGLFHGLGYEVFTKTTGCEAMIIHAVPGFDPLEVFLYRSYDKATIWEQSDVVRLAAKLGAEVFTWECMALNPRYARHLQHEWMGDDLVTITNAYPDHEDIQGPAGVDVARVIGEFIPRGAKTFCSELNFRPLFSDLARAVGTELAAIPEDNANLLPDDVLARFPYREHPRNIALIQSLAADLGVDPLMALYHMADHVVADLGVLREYPEITVRGRTLRFINGMSANERAGFMSNWKAVGCDDGRVDPVEKIATVVNNRDDRPARSKVFARILVEDAHADRHFVIGTGVAAFVEEVELAARAFLAEQRIFEPQDAPGAAVARLARAMKRQRVPEPDAEVLLTHLDALAAGAGSTVSPAERPRLGREIRAFLDAPWAGEPTLESIRKTALEQPWIAHLGAALAPASPADGPELLEPADAEAVRAAFVRLLARTTYRAILARELDRAAPQAARHEAYHGLFRELSVRLTLDLLVPVLDPGLKGDQIIDLIARALPPGARVRLMGVQNIKGTGLDFAYRWVSLYGTHKHLTALRTPGRRTAALRALEITDGCGYFDLMLAEHTVRALRPTFAGLDATLADKLLPRLEAARLAKRQTLEQGVAAKGALARWLDRVEGLVDWADEIRRRRAVRQIMADLGARRISHARAALEVQALVLRGKGGWLAAGLLKKPTAEQALPPLETPAPLPAAQPAAQPVWLEPIRSLAEQPVDVLKELLAERREGR